MIPARKRPWFEAAFGVVNRSMLRRQFHGLYCAGLQGVRGGIRAEPMILFGNHSCWWDGLIEFHLSKRVLGLDAYLMMEERQMRRYRFFRWIGAFSVNRHSARESVRSLRYAAQLLLVPGRALWIYPQGEMLHNDVRPLRFFPGVVRLLEMVPRVTLVPFVHRYEFRNEQRPDAFVRFGVPRVIEGCTRGRELLPGMERELTDLLDGLKSDILLNRLDAYEAVLRGESSASSRWDRLRMIPPEP